MNQKETPTEASNSGTFWFEVTVSILPLYFITLSQFAFLLHVFIVSTCPSQILFNNHQKIIKSMLNEHKYLFCSCTFALKHKQARLILVPKGAVTANYLRMATVIASEEPAHGQITSGRSPRAWNTLRKASQDDIDPEVTHTQRECQTDIH